jgi:hypothetical protein
MWSDTVFAANLLGRHQGISVSYQDIMETERMWFVARIDGGACELLRHVKGSRVRLPLSRGSLDALVEALRGGGVLELEDEDCVLDGGAFEVGWRWAEEERTLAVVNPQHREALDVIWRLFGASMLGLRWSCLTGRW